MSIAIIIDKHRVGSTSFGTFYGRGGRKIQCQCGWISVAYYDEQTYPIDGEHNPERETQRMHAEHVAEVLKSYQEQEQREAADQRQSEMERQKVERVSPLGTSGLTFRAVERSTATKFQIQTFEREYPEQVVADLLRRAAYEIGKHEDIPTQVKIDRAPAGQGEKITVTWFA